MKRWLAPIALAAALASGFGTAVAAPNPNKPAPNYADPFVLEDAVGSDCVGFAVTAQLTGKSKFISLSDGDRAIGISPGTTITLTGPSGKTVSYVITGALHFEFLPAPDNGIEIRATGRNLLIVPSVPGPKGHPEGLFLTQGNFDFALNQDGSERRLFSGSGRVTDVCALLAP